MGNLYLHEMKLFLMRWMAFPRELRRSRALPDFEMGDIYLDCAYHPVIATEAVRFRTAQPGCWDADLAGVSMIDGSGPRSCSVFHCAPQKISLELALLITIHWEEFNAALDRLNALYETHPELQRLRE